MQDIAAEELAEAMLERVRTFTHLLAETPVDELEVKERATVIFRVRKHVVGCNRLIRGPAPEKQAESRRA